LEKLNDNPLRKLYQSCLVKENNVDEEEQYGVFKSSLNFLNDLIELGYLLLKSADRKATLCQCLRLMNKQLPADVYLPFKSEYVQEMKVASIVFE
jgi:hypothetical protein